MARDLSVREKIANISIMTRWRPRRGWFEAETPRLFAIARRTDHLPELADVFKCNFPET